MTPGPARYLLRLDDLCPTAPRARLDRLQGLMEEFRVCPILAVIPDNQDRELAMEPPDPDFWARMRALQAAGAVIGLHGYRHLCASRGRSLVPLHRFTEFAGVPEATQRNWMRAGLAILRAQGLNPRLWVAPRHGFDRVTLRVLHEEGIRVVSDGLARMPFQRGGVTWLPQQLWAPVEKPWGLWTILLHTHTASDALIDDLRAFLRHHAGQFMPAGQAMAEFGPKLPLTERLYEAAALLRFRQRQLRKRLSGRR